MYFRFFSYCAQFHLYFSQLTQRVAKLANKTHKDRVSEFNSHLESLSEHHDIPKVLLGCSMILSLLIFYPLGWTRIIYVGFVDFLLAFPTRLCYSLCVAFKIHYLPMVFPRESL